MDTKQAILSRRSVRKFLDKEVSKEDITALLEAGCNAPSACNKKPLRFFVITDKKMLSELRESGRFTKMSAPLAIVVTGDMNETLPSSFSEYWVQDAAAATENILIMATALGLGSCWNGVHLQAKLISRISELLGMPEHILPFSLIWIGYSNEFPEPHEGYDPERVKFIG